MFPSVCDGCTKREVEDSYGELLCSGDHSLRLHKDISEDFHCQATPLRFELSAVLPKDIAQALLHWESQYELLDTFPTELKFHHSLNWFWFQLNLDKWQTSKPIESWFFGILWFGILVVIAFHCPLTVAKLRAIDETQL
jgi:hypothetical protein